MVKQREKATHQEHRKRERERGIGKGWRGGRGPVEYEHVTGVVNISLAFVLRRPTDVPGFIYALCYIPVQPVAGFLLLTWRSYPYKKKKTMVCVSLHRRWLLCRFSRCHSIRFSTFSNFYIDAYSKFQSA